MIDDTTPNPETFVLDSEEKVNWLLRKLGNLEAEKARITQQSREMLARLDSEEKSLRWKFEEGLKAFAVSRLEEDHGKRKSVILLQGTLAFRTQPRAIKLTDTTAALRYAQERGLKDAVKTVETLETSAYAELAAKTLEGTGELLPGMDVQPERELFSIRFAKREE